jgi:VanZ family protein
MFKFRQIVPRWLPSLLVMFVIFLFSSQPSANLPDFGWADRIAKKGGHMLGYGFLALTYWYGFGWERKRLPLAWVFALFYAVTDEYHQSFVSGRHPSIWDVLIFDNLGAFLGLWLAGFFMRQKRPDENA